MLHSCVETSHPNITENRGTWLSFRPAPEPAEVSGKPVVLWLVLRFLLCSRAGPPAVPFRKQVAVRAAGEGAPQGSKGSG